MGDFDYVPPPPPPQDAPPPDQQPPPPPPPPPPTSGSGEPEVGTADGDAATRAPPGPEQDVEHDAGGDPGQDPSQDAGPPQFSPLADPSQGPPDDFSQMSDPATASEPDPQGADTATGDDLTTSDTAQATPAADPASAEADGANGDDGSAVEATGAEPPEGAGEDTPGAGLDAHTPDGDGEAFVAPAGEDMDSTLVAQGPRDPEPAAGPSLRRLSTRERSERERVAPMWGRGVAFGFGEREPAPGEVNRWLGTLNAGLLAALGDQRTILTITTLASTPGTDAANQRLTEQRLAAVIAELRKHGVKATIAGNAAGESAARAASPTPMALGDGTKAPSMDDRDNGDFRVAVIEIRPHAGQVDMDPEVVAPGPQSSDAQRVETIYAEGKQVCDGRIMPMVDEVRAAHPVPANPIAPDPGADLKTQGKQMIDVFADARDTPSEVIAKILIGNFIEIGRQQMRDEVAAARRPEFQAIAEGVAAGLDPDYQRPKHEGPEEARAAEAQRRVEQLSDDAKDQLGAYLIENERRGRVVGEAGSWAYIEERLKGDHLKEAMLNRLTDYNVLRR